MEKLEIIIKKEDYVFESYNKILALFDSRDKINFKIDGEALYEILGFLVYLERMKMSDTNEGYEDFIKGLRKDNKA